MAEIRWTSEATTWLNDIYDYIAHDNPTAAATDVAGIYKKAQLLQRYPEIGYKYVTNRKEIFEYYCMATIGLRTFLGTIRRLTSWVCFTVLLTSTGIFPDIAV